MFNQYHFVKIQFKFAIYVSWLGSDSLFLLKPFKLLALVVWSVNVRVTNIKFYFLLPLVKTITLKQAKMRDEGMLPLLTSSFKLLVITADINETTSRTALLIDTVLIYNELQNNVAYWIKYTLFYIQFCKCLHLCFFKRIRYKLY